MGSFSRATPERNYPSHLLNHETSDHLLSLVEKYVPCVGHERNMSHSRLAIKDYCKKYLAVMISSRWLRVAIAPKSQISAISSALYKVM
jgi:hypothetical protein